LETLLDIRFDELNEQHVLGDWVVLQRLVRSELAGTELVKADQHAYQTGGVWRLSQGAEAKGSWQLARDPAMMNRPYIKYRLSDTGWRGLITRFRVNTTGTRAIMNLYLSDGTELTLQKG
jgi:hypothetical protein